MDIIALVDSNWGIAKNGKQIIYIPEDLKYFKEKTLNKTIIVGRKTFETFPNKKPLPKRKNIILSNDKSLKIDGAQICNNMDELIKISPKDSFVIGGESVYNLLIKYCDTAYITQIGYDFHADKYFPNLDKNNNWKLISSSENQIYKDYNYCYKIYKRIK